MVWLNGEICMSFGASIQASILVAIPDNWSDVIDKILEILWGSCISLIR
jgi:hypothetical protein